MSPAQYTVVMGAGIVDELKNEGMAFMGSTTKGCQFIFSTVKL
jgi:hypothetical protein